MSFVPPVDLAFQSLDRLESKSVALKDRGRKTLSIVSLARFLPDRRFSGAALLDGRAVFAKVFAPGARGLVRAQREQKAHGKLSERGVLCPALIDMGFVGSSPLQKTNSTGPSPVLIFERLESQFDFQRLAPLEPDQADDQLLLRQIAALAALLGQHHANGIRQDDLHLGNFMSTKLGVQTLDFGSLSFDQSLSPRERARNFAALLIQVDPRWYGAIAFLLSHYQKAGGEPLDQKIVRNEGKLLWEERRRRFARKVQRDSSATRIHAIKFGTFAINRVWGANLAGLEDALAQEILATARGKRAARVTIKWQEDKLQLVFSKGVFREAHARNDWIEARQLGQWGLPILRARLCLNRFPRRPVVAFEAGIADAIHDELWQRSDTGRSARRKLAKALARFDLFGCRMETLDREAICGLDSSGRQDLRFDSTKLRIRWLSPFDSSGPCPRILGINQDFQEEIATAFASACASMRSAAASINP
ncbi:MAG: hypothetical protein V3W41_03010 [Planctomycetota bacterium]